MKPVAEAKKTERHRMQSEQLHDEVGVIFNCHQASLGIKPEHLNSDLQLHDKSKELLDDAIQSAYLLRTTYILISLKEVWAGNSLSAIS